MYTVVDIYSRPPLGAMLQAIRLTGTRSGRTTLVYKQPYSVEESKIIVYRNNLISQCRTECPKSYTMESSTDLSSNV